MKICLPAPAAEIISTLLPKAILDAFLTCPACERDTIRVGVLSLSFVCRIKISQDILKFTPFIHTIIF